MILATIALSALLSTTPDPYSQVIEVRIHSLDVYVTDAKGAPVSGLRQEDFEILESGVPQEITNFSAFQAGGDSDDPQEPKDARPSVPPPTTYVFSIDTMALQVSTVRNLEKALYEIVDAMRPGDSAAVLQPDHVASTTLRFVTGRAEIRNSIHEALAKSRIAGRQRGFEREWTLFRGALANADTDEEGRLLANRFAAQARRQAREQVGALRGTIAAIAQRPGRKILIAVTQSLPARPGQEFFDAHLAQAKAGALSAATADTLDVLFQQPPGQNSPLAPAPPVDPTSSRAATTVNRRANYDIVDMLPTYQEAARLASSMGVQLSILRPDHNLPLRAVTATITEKQEVSNNSGASNASVLWNAIQNTDQAVKAIVDITGGHDLRPNDLDRRGTRDITRDLTNYYSLGYRGSGLDQVHRVEIRLRNRPDLRVRTRREVERKSPAREFTDTVVAALLTGQSANPLGITLRGSRKPGAGAGILVEAMIPLDALQFVLEDGFHRARYSAHYAIAGQGHQFITGADLEQEIRIPEADWAQAQGKVWSHALTLNGQLSGYRIAVGVRDATTGTQGLVVSEKLKTP